jgi:hypothetical protein
LTLLAYMAVVVATTPNLSPATALAVALGMNGPVMFGLAALVGLQMALASYIRSLGCPIRAGRPVAGAVGGSGASAFFSFFSLIQVGCCGMWLYILSLLPGVLGVGLSEFLIANSGPLTLTGFAVMGGSLAYTISRIYRLRRAKIKGGLGGLRPA